jgi:nucleoside-diphosphate-sugar epimerase/predicted dehydrogenase
MTTPQRKSFASPALRVAIIGAGRMARAHVAAIGRISGSTVAGVYDTSHPAALALGAMANAPAFVNLDDLFTEVRPQVVHVCTPAATHFAPAAAALRAGAHVYVEKPFVEASAQARTLLALARRQDREICVGHQVARDPAFTALLHRGRELAPLVRVDSDFTFRPVGVRDGQAGPATLAAHLLDIVPHPLATLLVALETLVPDAGPAVLEAVCPGAADLHAVIRVGSVRGRLSVSLRARPIVSTLTLAGGGGTLTADFIRGTVVGAGNSGTEPLEKLGNPVVEAWQLGTRSLTGVLKRITGGVDYPGLSELIGEFHQAVALRNPPPFPPEHLQNVTDLYEELAEAVRGSLKETAPRRHTEAVNVPPKPVAVVTGARGFLGHEITRSLVKRGYHVRGVSRSPDVDHPYVHEWVRADLGRSLAPEALSGAEVVVHAAAETSGGYEDHERNSVDATRHVLAAMKEAGVRRLVYVSSISVVQPPRLRERQHEGTPLPADAHPLGAYTWGKTEAERLVSQAMAARQVDAKIIRPGALVEWRSGELPGLLGRRLFGRWHLGLGRPGLPLPICDVRNAGAAIAWSVECFDEAPEIVNLFEEKLATRRAILEKFRSTGWRGRMVWMPIPVFAGLFSFARMLIGALKRRRAERLDSWSILRPRRFKGAVATWVLSRALQPSPPPQSIVEIEQPR